jgi:hypothetical protein
VERDYLAYRRGFIRILEESKITGLNKYNKFMPIPIKFGTKQKHFLSQKMLQKIMLLKREQITSSTILIQLGQNNQRI